MLLKETNEKEVLSNLLKFAKVKNKKVAVEKLLEKFGTVKEVVNAEQLELETVVSKQTAEFIKFMKDFVVDYNYLQIKEKTKISNPTEVVDYLKAQMSGNKMEKVYVILLNNANKINKVVELEEGTESRSIVYPRNIVRLCIQYFATAVIISHSHPANNLKPSQNDIILTEALAKALKTIDTYLLDHIIITDTDFYSFKDNGLL